MFYIKLQAITYIRLNFSYIQIYRFQLYVLSTDHYCSYEAEECHYSSNIEDFMWTERGYSTLPTTAQEIIPNQLCTSVFTIENGLYQRFCAVFATSILNQKLVITLHEHNPLEQQHRSYFSKFEQHKSTFFVPSLRRLSAGCHPLSVCSRSI